MTTYQQYFLAAALATGAFTIPSLADEFILNNRAGVSVDVIRKDATGAETYLTTVLANDVVTVDAQPNDLLSFKMGASNGHEGVDQIRMIAGKKIYDLRMVAKTVDQLPASYKSVPNFDPSLHSYDIFFVDPFHIDNSKAKKGLVFERLGLKDRDYVVQDGNIYHKKGFNFQTDDTGWGETETEYHASTRSFLDKFSIGIKLGGSKGPKDAKAKGSLGASYSKMTKNVSKDKRAWTTSRQDIIKYHVATVGTQQQLSADFVNAIIALPDNPSGGDWSKTSSAVKSQYSTFISTWGTHYPTLIEYGGIFLGIRSMTESQVIDTIEEGFDIKAEAQVPVKGVAATGALEYGQKEIKTTSQLDKKSVSKYMYRGGTGGKSGWTVDDGAQPVSIKLNRLQELFDSRRISAVQQDPVILERKKATITAAITEYLGNAVDVNSYSIKPRIYELHWTEFYPNDLDDSKDAVYGKISVSHVGGLGKDLESDSHSNTLWNRSSNGGSRVILQAGQAYSDRYPGAFKNTRQRFVVRPGPNGDYDIGKKGIKISANLKDYDKSSGDDDIGSASKTVYLKDFKPGKETQLVVNDGGPDDDTNENGKITLTFKIQQINTAFDRLYSKD